MPNNLIIEGLSGTGKSTIIRKLTKLLSDNNLDYKLFSEEDTFGEFMAETKNFTEITPEHLFRLTNILKEIESIYAQTIILLERFHLSSYALFPNWYYYSDIDQLLRSNNFLLVLLTYNKNLILDRALRHKDLNDETGIINYFGSLEKALSAYETSQLNRKEALAKTKIPFVEIDTSEMDWDIYASKIYNYLTNSSFS